MSAPRLGIPDGKRIVAVWQSRSGKHEVVLYADEWGYGYRSHGASGNMGKLADDAAAIAQIEPRINDFQPDANTTPMRRTA